MAGPFIEKYRSIVEPLFDRRLSASDGISERELDTNLERCGYEVPEVLRDFYTSVGRFDPVMESFNRFYLPGSLSKINDKRVFCEENQVVVYWGYKEDDGWRTDPVVYQGINNDEIEWYPEPGRCSDFLVGMIYWQALHGGLPAADYRLRANTETQLAAASWPLVHQDEDLQIFSRSTVVFSLATRETGVEVQAASTSKALLAGLWKSLGLEANRK